MAQTLRDLDNVKTFPDVNAGASTPVISNPPSAAPGTGSSRGGHATPGSKGRTKDSKSKTPSVRTPTEHERRVQLPGLVKVAKPAMVPGRPADAEPSQPLVGFNSSSLKMDTIEPLLAGGSSSLMGASFAQPTLAKVDLNKQTGPKKKAVDPVTAQLRTYATLMDTYSLHNFIIWNGKALRNTPEFASFQRTYIEMWSNIVTVVSLLETYLSESQVKMAVISGQKVAELAVLNLPYTSKKELMNCVTNEDQVRSQMVRGAGRDEEFDKIRAIIRIQTAGRQILAMKSVRVMREKIAAAIVIQCAGRRYISRQRFLRLSKQSHVEHDKIWNAHQERFVKSYGTIQAGQSRIVVYLPSICAAEYLRISMDDISIHQNAHVSVFHQLLNPDVHLLYISPHLPSAQLMAFHEKLLGMLGAPEGTIRRVRVITPEMSLRLPEHVPVGQALWYSGATLRKIRSIAAKYQHAVFVPSTLSFIEKRIANFLGIGSLCPDPTIGAVLRSRSHARRVFIDGNVNVPIGAHDIDSEEDLLVALARLISCNLDIDRWFIKLNSDFNGESLAILDCGRLPVVRSLRDEQAALLQANHNNALVWFEHRVQMNARKRIAGSFHHHHMSVVDIIRRDLYHNWHGYANRIRQVGCLVEAEPPCSLSVLECVCLMEPRAHGAGEDLPVSHSAYDIDEGSFSIDGGGGMADIDADSAPPERAKKPFRRGGITSGGVSIRILETHSKLTDDFGQVQGSMYPQPLHIFQESIEGAVRAICSNLWEKINCIGYVTIRFLASWDDSDQIVRLLGSELSFGFSALVGAIGTNSVLRAVSVNTARTLKLKTGKAIEDDFDSSALANAPFFKFVGGGTGTGGLKLVAASPLWSPSERSDGSYLYLPAIYHAPLRNCRDDVFFKLCKLSNVAYDPVHQTGVMFFLVDSISSGQLSMLVMGGTGNSSGRLLRAETTEGRQYHPPAIRARLTTLQLAVTALTFINRSFGKDSDLLEAAGFDGSSSTVHDAKSADQVAAKACISLSSMLISLKKLLKREQKIADAFQGLGKSLKNPGS